jgi:hypothetical protein
MKRAVVVAALLTAACGPSLIKLPSGSAKPVPPAEATRALADALGECSNVRSLSAEVAVSGRVEDRRVRGRIVAATARPASARLEAVVSFGPPLFVFVTRDGDATLLLPRENRVLPHGRPASVLEAIAGVPLDAADLHDLLTGCAEIDRTPPSATGFADLWQVVTIRNAEVYLRRERASDPWRVVTTVRSTAQADERWRADFADARQGVPRAIHLVSVSGQGRIGQHFDLQLGLSQVDINPPLDQTVFSVRLPEGASPITVDDLRRSGPFGLATNGR